MPSHAEADYWSRNAPEGEDIDQGSFKTGSTKVNSANRGLSVVKNLTTLIQFNGRKIKVVGYYVSQSWDPGMTSNTFEFKGVYHAAQIILEDGTVVSIFPPGQKQSLRPTSEVNKYQGKIVTAIGIIKIETKLGDSPQSNQVSIELQELQLVHGSENKAPI